MEKGLKLARKGRVWERVISENDGTTNTPGRFLGSGILPDGVAPHKSNLHPRRSPSQLSLRAH